MHSAWGKLNHLLSSAMCVGGRGEHSKGISSLFSSQESDIEHIFIINVLFLSVVAIIRLKTTQN